MMSFMQLFTEHGDWYLVDGSHGMSIVPRSVTGSVALEQPIGALRAAFADYYEGPASGIESVTLERGWCARYSAPGYLDCTDWVGPYATVEEAERECRSLFGDGDDDDEG